MARDLALPLEFSAKTLPTSKMKYPTSLVDRIKYIFWRLYTPTHPFFRDTLLSLGLIWHDGRQNFILGTIAPGQSIASVVSFLLTKGYGNHFIAWKDDGEVIGLRFVDNFTFQYHIRIFKDGEVRGHYEYTPECHPVWHFKAIGLKDRRSEFLTLLGDKIIPSPN